MKETKEPSKGKRIKKEITKLRSLLKNIPKDKLTVADGLIKRVAFMQITLEDLEDDINLHGTVETFSQTENIEYDRQRPAAQIYNTTIKNYSAACKQLFDLLPDDKPKTDKDELMQYIKDKK